MPVAPPPRPPGEPVPAPALVAAGGHVAVLSPPGPAPRVPAWVSPGLIVLLAAVLRLVGLGAMRDDPFYDAAVRSMGGSWHAFITGAIDPSAAVAVDKPPVDLWLQVASTKLLGFGTLGLHLPEAIGGTLAVLALYDLLHTLFGRRAALAGALALAVMPIPVITSRSDTMDSVMAALVVTAAALTARAARRDRPALLLAAGAILGLAFEVKLFEGLIAAPALVLLWWLGSALPRPRRAAALAGAAVTFTVVALAWLAVLPVLGGAHRPWAFGSTNGSAWNATFVYDGLHRVTGFPPTPRPVIPGANRPPTAHQRVARARALAQLRRRHLANLAQAPAPPSPWRLFAPRDHVGLRAGVPIGLALLALLAAALAGAGRGLDRLQRAGAVALTGWLGTGLVLFSVQKSLKPRYLEAVDPAVAAVFGAGLALAVSAFVVRRARRRAGGLSAARLTAIVAGLALVVPAAASVAAVASRAEDAGAPGAITGPRFSLLVRYLDAHRRGARYQAATITVGAAASLISHDGRPVLVLAANDARPLVTVPQLRRDIVTHRVRIVLLGAPCAVFTPDVFTGCSPLARWVRAHGVDVSRAAGQPYTSFVYAFPHGVGSRTRSQAFRHGSGRGTPTSVPSSRSPGAHRRHPHPASRARHRRSGRVRRRSRRGTAPSAAR
ncbi:glycosyltransferase family 39 protein [Paraconexibacter antarcticus]|uniref:Glycosyltransferase family 39 protein n=1 Tax=Paraconexibacter antarcticus TaxID=2949664 RepID=A0ABY5DR17_9ACTN|nr:glycosyltransferase family 39 protein [Paraconexibacter antarcticus]UTI64473.1 glycosyltransferase family 39 protein [Paraconexibacter antarcticus]